MADVATLAEAFADSFETRTRANGDSFVALKDGSPEWMRDALYAAHGGMFPDDWKFDAAQNLLFALAEGADPDDMGEALDSQVDVYTGRLTAWLASSLTRVAYCDDDAKELGPFDSVTGWIQAGQYCELRDIAAALADALRAQSDDVEA